MLIEFSVANYRSFKERASISLVASNDKTLCENTFPVKEGHSLSLIKSAAIYGANAAGKSNLINALQFMKRFVIESAGRAQLGGASIGVAPFKLDNLTQEQPSFFEIVFMLHGERYVYGFTVDRQRVHEEWLTVAKVKPRKLFERTADGTVTFGDSWRGDMQKLQQTDPQALVLSTGVALKNPIATAIVDWFKVMLRFISESPERQSSDWGFTLEQFLNTSDFRADFERFINAADLGIARCEVQRIDLSDPKLHRKIPKDQLKKIILTIPTGANLSDYILFNYQSIHRMPDGSVVPFNLENEESAGTKRLFGIAGPWIQAIHEGCTLLVDELDIKLHPVMTRFLISLIHQAPQSQLIFTTHDCSLLDSGLFRRDQIWFVEKNPETGATDLYSLWDIDINVRKEENYRLGYLKGRYGAIPFIGELNFA